MSPRTRSRTSTSTSAGVTSRRNTPISSAAAVAAAPITSHVGRKYLTTIDSDWGGNVATIRVKEEKHGLNLAILPAEFMRDCGDNTWSYIYKVLQMATECDGRNGLVYGLDDDTPHPRTSEAVPLAGMYLFRMTDNTEVKISKGPANKRGKLLGAPNLDESESTVSRSSRSSVGQSNLKTLLLIREHGKCFVSDEWFEACTAAHIVPFSRQDIYEEIYGANYDSQLFKPSSGLLLRDDLHRAYDRFEWSIFCHDDGAFYIHMFYYTVPHYRQYHGKRIDPNIRLSYKDSERKTEMPNRDLLQWHYKQCVQARVRGYAYNMNVNRQGGEKLL